ncbi:MAG: M81 family metallopeptidase [Planctomycetota bacterium]
MRIVIAECKQEVSSFNPAPSAYSDFRVARGDALLAHHRGCREEIAGAVQVFEKQPELRLAPAWGGSANTSGGVLSADGFARLSGEFWEELRRVVAEGPVDGAYFCLHGAMQAESEDDPEGCLLEGARRILGERTPIVISLDLHGILTDRMLRHCDAVVAYHTYPHVDFVETGARAARVLLDIVLRKARPVMARVKLPALVRGDELITETGAIRHCIQRSREIEADPRALAAAVMWGNPFTDVPELRSNAIVVADGDPQLAAAWAQELAELFWRDHERMRVPLTSLEESVRRAAEVKQGTVVMMDAADATSSGASGDSNAIIRETIRQGYGGRVLAPIVDPSAVRKAMEAGIGAEVVVTLGGAIDRRFEPLPVTARVRLLSDGRFRSETFGWPWDSGPTAVLEAKNLTLVVGTRPVSLFDRSWFLANGQDPRRFDMVVVKSPHCEPHMFTEWCAMKIDVDAPGATSANVKALGHRKCARPMFPLDGVVPFDNVADLFD